MMGFECRFRRECRVIQARLLLSYKARRWQFRGSRLTANYGPGILIHPNGPDVRETGPRKQRLSFSAGKIPRDPWNHVIEHDRSQVRERKRPDKPVVLVG